MTEKLRQDTQDVAGFDPSGSIFLPKHPRDAVQHFERLDFALMLKRPPFDDTMTPDEQQELYAELRQVRTWWFGHAIAARTCVE